MIRSNWTIEELEELYGLALLDLISKSHDVHRHFHDPSEIQVCSLISIKTGGCSEDCKYCAQSSRYQTGVSAQAMMSYEDVLGKAWQAVKRGVTRICLGVAWRLVRDGRQFEDVLRMVKGIADLGVEVCCTLGMLTEEQARQLKEAGLYAYNHNLDSSERFYKTIITTRTYQDRLDTLKVVKESGLSVCCGGILGLGEQVSDRLELLHTLSSLDPHPESVPINQLSQVPGTPLESQQDIPFWEVLRVISLARIVMPRTMIRLSCGRVKMSYEQHALCFFAGANSIFDGEKLLTVGNTPLDRDEEMFRLFGLKRQEAYKKC